MRLLQPSGLWALAGLAVLIALHLFREQYDEHAVSSTYLWKLSERFQKKRMPLQRLKKVLLFVLQALMIVLCALMLAQPRLPLPGSGTEHILILDTSASMRAADAQGATRFERARSAMLSHVAQLPDGAAVTVLASGEKAVRLTERSTSQNEIAHTIGRAQCGYGEDRFDSAIAAAQENRAGHPNAEVFLYTDHHFSEEQNITVVNVAAEGEWNGAITALTAEDLGNGLVFTCTVASYGADADLTLAFYLDDALKGAQTVPCAKDGTAVVTWQIPHTYTFRHARAVINGTDSLLEDNAFSLFRQPEDTVRTLLVGETTYYLERALSVFSQVDLETCQTPEETTLSGYDVYVFDGCAPKTLPTDGAVWLVNPAEVPAEWGVTLAKALRGAPLSVRRQFADERFSVLVKDLSFQNVSALKFREATEYGAMEPVLLCGELPAMLAGRSDRGLGRALLLFDLHDSNLPLTADYILLVNNLLSYSMPAMFDTLLFESGRQIQATVLPLTENLYLTRPDDTMQTLLRDGDTAPFVPEMPGVYTLLQQRADASAKYCDVFVRLPLSQSDISLKESSHPLVVPDAPPSRAMEQTEDEQAMFDPLRYLAMLILLVLILEGVVFNREQF